MYDFLLVIMAAMRSRCGHYIFALWFLSIIFFFFYSQSQRPQIGSLPHFHTWCGPSVNLECGFEMCCTRLTGNTGRKNDAKNRHLRHIFLMSLQYSELRPTSSWDRFVSLGHPSKFQRALLLGNVIAQPNCGVEQRAPPMYGRAPSRWALAHISS